MLLYKIVNTKNAKTHIGKTTRINPNTRRREHWYLLRTGNHFNKHLQSAWNKYGENSFEYKVIGQFSSEEELDQAEEFAIENGRNLYNIAKGGRSNIIPKECRIKAAESHKIPIIGMDVRTGELKEYMGGVDAAKDGFNTTCIWECCKLKVRNCGGIERRSISTKKWVWMYKSEFSLEEMSRRREMAINKTIKGRNRAIIAKSLMDGSIVHFESKAKAAKTLNGAATAIWRACMGYTVRSHKGYIV
jgi:group I intron endonuclease